MNVEQLKLVVDEVIRITKDIKNNYPKLSFYPVFSHLAGQCDLTTNIKEILKYFPDMVHDSEEKDKAIKISNIVSALKAELKQADEIKNANIRINKINSLTNDLQDQIPELNQLTNRLEICGDIFIELRFEKHVLDEIFRLQSDHLVSQRYTPQTNASVRIVLGNIADLCEDHLRQKE